MPCKMYENENYDDEVESQSKQVFFSGLDFELYKNLCGEKHGIYRGLACINHVISTTLQNSLKI